MFFEPYGCDVQKCGGSRPAVSCDSRKGGEEQDTCLLSGPDRCQRLSFHCKFITRLSQLIRHSHNVRHNLFLFILCLIQLKTLLAIRWEGKLYQTSVSTNTQVLQHSPWQTPTKERSGGRSGTPPQKPGNTHRQRYPYHFLRSNLLIADWLLKNHFYNVQEFLECDIDITFSSISGKYRVWFYIRILFLHVIVTVSVNDVNLLNGFYFFAQNKMYMFKIYLQIRF